MLAMLFIESDSHLPLRDWFSDIACNKFNKFRLSSSPHSLNNDSIFLLSASSSVSDSVVFGSMSLLSGRLRFPLSFLRLRTVRERLSRLGRLCVGPFSLNSLGRMCCYEKWCWMMKMMHWFVVCF